MISIFIMFSNDRWMQLNSTIQCLQRMDDYKVCQKTLVVDGKLQITAPADFQVIEVPRVDGFCWADMWEAGVATAKYEKIWYLDSDRLLPVQYLKQLTSLIRDNNFCFSSRHFMMLEELPFNDSLKFIGIDQKNINIFDARIKFEPRFKEVTHSPRKNVMSGNTAFTKTTYYRLGGVDRWYKGHGAFADNDFHMIAKTQGCDFVDLELTELHCFHQKKEKDQHLSVKELAKLSLDNYIHYCKKWNLPITYAEDLAKKSSIPTSYVKTKW